MKKLLLIPVVISVIVFSCKKKDTRSSGEKTFTFNSLRSDHDSIAKGNVTNIRASVSGNVTYAWSASAGDIFNSGSTILFGASTCCTGNHTITCKVTDQNNNSESKSVVVEVH